MFFQDLKAFAGRPAVVDGECQWTYRSLAEAVSTFADALPVQRSLLLIKASNSLETLTAYLACLQQEHVMLLVDGQVDDSRLFALLKAYDANAVVEQGEIHVRHNRRLSLSKDLALLLSTSGSTGSPKQVALSAGNLDANARAICDYLPIQSSDTTITTLPFYYSYGLSVINSHLRAGACLVMNEEPVVSRAFWERFREYGVNSLAGVPFTYDMLLRLRLTTMDLPSLRYLTQAGGKLAEPHIRTLAGWAIETGRQFFVMYGQTEATARMAYNDHPHRKPGAIGRAIPGGEFRLSRQDGSLVDQPEAEGELSYRGRNVMLGYAETLDDLAYFSGPEWLHTGDLAWFDTEGDFHISGRIKRFIKPFGQRISLDDVERLLEGQGISARATGSDKALQVAVLDRGGSSEDDVKHWLHQSLGLHPSAIQVRLVEALPVLGNGKPDYPAVGRLFDAS